eukprot:6715792-Prymnesium_polylepis.1
MLMRARAFWPEPLESGRYPGPTRQAREARSRHHDHSGGDRGGRIKPSPTRGWHHSEYRAWHVGA